MRWAGYVARMQESKSAYRVLVGKPEGRIPLGRPKPIWEQNIKFEVTEVGWGSKDWSYLARGRVRWRAVLNVVMNLRVS
jgi:hypothetical protein